ncbi:hypothetical protein S7711_06444 [Stachybotrys chartarum IBT 7711]|uniref:3'-5' exonuclease domain-containing protein n=1 Tax=Stachybotrys chartarum (strain CBS 109288 / IBT 7711) TaxID=1280523 RepID=A0A084AX60_STACB|nr:hypothetical protein S7711_06444 [Stachybotrys chartarum IBT 7711]KFA54682.1 hypothetical protein S40293_00808 [Stachybotrys chartarum IBT 40293]
MSSTSRRQLWDPRLGLRFSPRPSAAQLYPQLDLARFLHASSDDCSKSNGDAASQSCLKDASHEGSEVGRSNTAAEETDFVVPDAEHKVSTIADAIPTRDTTAPGEAKDVLPPVTSLEFNISSDLFYAARNSPVGSPASYWSHSMYEKTAEDGTCQKVKVHYCTSLKTMEYVCKKYFMGEEVLGFDLEWSPFANRNSGPREAVSLIQLASPSRIGLFHVAMFHKDDFVAPSFREIMESAAVSKVGVHVGGDCTRLRKVLGVQTKGIFEISHLYKLVKHSYDGRTELINKMLVSLSTQVQECLGLPLYKGENVRGSEWHKALNQEQIKYSASDAYAGIQLYHVLEAERLKLNPTPPRPHHYELGLPIRIAEPVVEAEADMTDAMVPEDELQAIIAEADIAGTPKTPQPPERDARITAAELEMKSYRSSKQKIISASPSSLRAYYIWHANDNLDPGSIAKLLRTPPLKTNTVVTYILDAIVSEKLPYNKKRVGQELLSTLQPRTMSSSKYQFLVQDCQSHRTEAPAA